MITKAQWEELLHASRSLLDGSSEIDIYSYHDAPSNSNIHYPEDEVRLRKAVEDIEKELS